MSGFWFTIHLCLIKFLSDDYSAGSISFLRAVVGTLLISPIMFRSGFGVLKLHQPGLVLLRGALGSLGFLLSISAVAAMPISQFNAISFSRPLFVILMAALVLGETVGPRRWAATAIGFLGVLIIVQPSTNMSMDSLMALGSAMCFAGAIVLVKHLSRSHATLTLLIYANVLTAVFTLPFAIADWKTPDMFSGVLIVAMALSGTAAQACYIKGMSLGEASFVSGMDFLRLPMTVTADWFVFAMMPTIWVWPGAGLIIAATLYIAYRESKVKPDQ